MDNPNIIDNEELKEARREGLAEVEVIVNGMARRAARPAKRQAMAELEATLERLRRQWTEQGLVA